MKKMLSVLMILACVFSSSTVMAQENIELQMGIIGGDLTIELPEISSLEQINGSTYKVNFTEMKIQDFQGVETDYKVSINLNVFDQEGNLKTEPVLVSRVTVEGNQLSFPHFEPIRLSSGTTQTIVSNDFKTFFSNSIYTYKDAFFTDIEPGDQIQINFQISF